MDNQEKELVVVVAGGIGGHPEIAQALEHLDNVMLVDEIPKNEYEIQLRPVMDLPEIIVHERPDNHGRGPRRKRGKGNKYHR